MTDRPDRPNVLVIVLDAVRADFLGSYSRAWSGDETFTPALDELAGRGARFANAVVSGNWTRPSVASIFTGLRPMRHADWFGGGGKNFFRRDKAGRPLVHSLAASFDTLAEVMSEAGYTTACFAPTHRGQFHHQSGFTQGFQFYEASPSDPGMVRSDQTFALLADWIEGEAPPGKPFFVYVHTLGAHAPFLPPAPYDELYRGAFARWQGEIPSSGQVRSFMIGEETRREAYLERYAGLLSHADHHLGVLLRRLGEAGALDETLLIVTADHGEELWDHGVPGHGQQLFEETIHVPLIVAGPGIEAVTVDAQVELVDLFPTVLELAGIESRRRLDGRSFLPLARGERLDPPHPTAVSFQNPNHVALRAGNRFKYIYTGPAARRGPHRSRLFDLVDDPGETTDVIAAHPALAFDLRLELQRSVLAQSAGWHLLFDPGPEAAELSAAVDLPSALYGAVDYHCVPGRRREESGDWVAGPCPGTAGPASPPVTVAPDGRRLEVSAALHGEALHVHFRPAEPAAPVRFDLRIDGEPAAVELLALGNDGARPPGSRFELGARGPASAGLWADGRPLADPGERRGITLWRVDFPPAEPEILPDETVERLRTLGYLD